MATVNLASKFAKKVDERFSLVSKAAMFTNNDYDWDGVDTINVYSVPVVELEDYNRNAAPGVDRYGTANELGNDVQKLQVKTDKSWTFTIDKANKIQTQMVMDAGKAAARQLREVVIPFYDKYVFKTMAAAACANEGHNNIVSTPIEPAKNTAYQRFLKGQEVLGDSMVPDEGRLCVCTYAFANLLMQDPAFMRYSNLSQEMINKGLLGVCDGVKLVRVPKTWLPAGANFMLAHPVATVAPKILSEYKIHTDPQGLSGWKVEGRLLMDAFVLKEKKNSIYFDGTTTVSAAAADSASVQTASTTGKKSA